MMPILISKILQINHNIQQLCSNKMKYVHTLYAVYTHSRFYKQNEKAMKLNQKWHCQPIGDWHIVDKIVEIGEKRRWIKTRSLKRKQKQTYLLAVINLILQVDQLNQIDSFIKADFFTIEIGHNLNWMQHFIFDAVCFV